MPAQAGHAGRIRRLVSLCRCRSSWASGFIPLKPFGRTLPRRRRVRLLLCRCIARPGY